MKSLITLTLSIPLVLFLTSCEVFKTTPRSSPEYRGTKSNTSTNQRSSTRYRDTERPTLLGQRNKNKENTGRTSADKRVANKPGTPAKKANTARTNKPNTPASKPVSTGKSLATRPARGVDASIPEVVQIARTYTGTPYRSGGNDKEGIDCSGLICQVYTEIGVKVPRISWQQSEFGREIEQIKDIQPGDWIFFVPEGGKEGYVSHSGIVTEVRGERDIVFIHASSSRGVIEDNLFSTYFRNRFVKAMRPF